VRLSRLLAAGASALVLSGLVAPIVRGAPAPAPAPVEFSFFSANSAGDGVRVFFDVVGFLPVTPALSLGTVTAEGFVESTRRTALALLPDPGGTVVSAPGLAAGLVGVPNVPGYPLVARADDPFTPHAEASPVLGTGAAVIRADASADRAAALARVVGAGSGDGLTGLAPVNDLVASLVQSAQLPVRGPLVDLGAAEVTVEQARPTASSLVATARSRLSGVNLLGGLVRIASIDATATARLDGTTASADPPEVIVSGVTVAGVPAQLTERGLSLAGSNSPLGGLLAPVVDPLLQQGVALRVAPSEATAEGTNARARSGGVVLEITSSFQGYPVVLRVSFGDVRAAVQGTVRAAQVDDTTSAQPTTGGAPLVGNPVGSLPLGTPALTTAVPRAGGTPGAPLGQATAVVDVIDLRRVYPFLGLLAAALVGSRGIAASRLRRRPGSSRAVQDLFRW
jgi:hypothetical protein